LTCVELYKTSPAVAKSAAVLADSFRPGTPTESHPGAVGRPALKVRSFRHRMAHTLSHYRVGPRTGRAHRICDPMTLEAAWYR
jgi:hypothetical protein